MVTQRIANPCISVRFRYSPPYFCPIFMTTDRKQVEEYIKDWATSETSPHFAVLIEGAWGCGKTHFIKGLTNNKDFTEKKIIYLSMFGLSNVADFERQLFYASASSTANFFHQSTSFIGSVFSSNLTVGSIGLPINFNRIFDKIGKKIEDSTNILNESLLILDDIERCQIPIQELLGVVNRFIEHGDTRVILLANAVKLDKEGEEPSFTTLREKIVGHSFMLTSDSKGAIDAFIKDINDAEVRAIIESRKDQICDLHNTSGYDNLRALRQFIWHLRGILEKLDEAHRKDAELIERLVHQAFVFFMEFKLDLSDESAELTPQSLWSKYHTNKDDARSVFEFSKNSSNSSDKKQEETPKYKILQKYDSIMHTVVGVKQWISILESGVVDKEWLNNDIVYPKEPEWLDLPSWKRLWHFHDWDFSHPDSEKQFDADLQDVIDKISNGSYKDHGYFLHVAGILLGFSESDLYQKTMEDTIQDMKNYIDTHLISNMTYENYTMLNSDLGIRSGYEGLGFNRQNKPDFQKIRSYLEKQVKNWYEEWKKTDGAAELFNYLNNKDFKKFLDNLRTYNNYYTNDYFLTEPILHVFNPVKFVDAWFSLPREQEDRLTESMETRYNSGFNLLELEGPWWELVKQELSKRQKAEQSKPRAVQIGNLIERIDVIILSLVKDR